MALWSRLKLGEMTDAQCRRASEKMDDFVSAVILVLGFAFVVFPRVGAIAPTRGNTTNAKPKTRITAETKSSIFSEARRHWASVISPSFSRDQSAIPSQNDPGDREDTRYKTQLCAKDAHGISPAHRIQVRRQRHCENNAVFNALSRQTAGRQPVRFRDFVTSAAVVSRTPERSAIERRRPG